MEANRLPEGSGSEGEFGGEGSRSWAAGLAGVVVLDNIWYAVFLSAPSALVLVPPLLGDMLALPLYRAMGENPLKGREIEGMPKGRWTRGFRGDVSDGVGFIVEGDGEFFIVGFYKRSV